MTGHRAVAPIAGAAEQSLGLHGYCDSKGSLTFPLFLFLLSSRQDPILDGSSRSLNRGNDLEVLRMLHEDCMTLSLHRQSRRNLPSKVSVVQGI